MESAICVIRVRKAWLRGIAFNPSSSEAYGNKFSGTLPLWNGLEGLQVV